MKHGEAKDPGQWKGSKKPQPSGLNAKQISKAEYKQEKLKKRFRVATLLARGNHSNFMLATSASPFN